MISAIILAAGESKRMGQPKMLLPWGTSTVLGHVISTFQHAGVEDVIVVTGGSREQVHEIAEQHGARSVFNEDYVTGDMLSSVQCGLRLLAREEPGIPAALISLGDQPQVQEETVRHIRLKFHESGPKIIVPSFEMRRGHPWLVERSLWPELLAMEPPHSLRHFLDRYAHAITYMNVDTPSILADLDTPQDYQASRPQS